MTSEEIIQQTINARDLTMLMDSEHTYDDPVSILNVLAIAGFKLVPLTEQDFDEDGVSVVSKAYMYSVVENIEGSHYNSSNLKEEKSYSSEKENFDDFIEDDLDQDDLFDDE